MRRIITSLSHALLAALMFTTVATAQIQLTRSSIELFLNAEFTNTSATSSEVEKILQLLEIKGGVQTWDFTDLEMDVTMTGDGRIETFSSAVGTPGEGDEHFEQATHVSRSEANIKGIINGEEVEVTFTSYEFSIITDEAYTILGAAVPDFLVPDEMEMLIYDRPGQVKYVFPVTYESAWGSEYEEQSIFGGFDNTLDYIEEVTVDGWGEIITPHGTFEVLRVSRLSKIDFGFFVMESLEVDFVNENGLPLATISVGIDPLTGEYDTGEVEASLNVITTSTSAPREPAPELPARLTLHQNYPNPFNPSTQITYDLAEASIVSLEMYSLTGTRVQSVIDSRYQQAGTHTVTVDASHLASGIYFYQLRAGGQVLTRQMALVK